MPCEILKLFIEIIWGGGGGGGEEEDEDEDEDEDEKEDEKEEEEGGGCTPRVRFVDRAVAGWPPSFRSPAPPVVRFRRRPVSGPTANYSI